MKMTYAEQLRHPNWQRKRLEVLAASDFKCVRCGTGERTLNVHHKRYVKGRMAWEYEHGELEALCESCHKTEHDARDWLATTLSARPSLQMALMGSEDMRIAWRLSAHSDPAPILYYVGDGIAERAYLAGAILDLLLTGGAGSDALFVALLPELEKIGRTHAPTAELALRIGLMLRGESFPMHLLRNGDGGQG